MPPAARVGDPHVHTGALMPPGCPSVMIGGLPAARVGDMAACTFPPPAGPHGTVPIVPPASMTVVIGGMPAARVGDMTGCGSAILPPGCPSVMIG